MRADAAFEHGIAVDGEMVRGDGRGDIRAAGFDERHGFGGGDMFENDLQRRIIADQPGQGAFDEHRLAIENIDMAVGDFTMDQQRHPDPLHGVQRIADLRDIGDAMRRIGGGMGGIQLGSSEHAVRMAALQFIASDAIGQITGHQRGEIQRRVDSGKDAVAIGGTGGRGGDRRLQIGHDDGAGKLPRRGVDNGGEHGAITQMDVPIVRPTDDQPVAGQGHAMSGTSGGTAIGSGATNVNAGESAA